jgi:regulatory protein
VIEGAVDATAAAAGAAGMAPDGIEAAMARAGRLLSRRLHSRAEVEERLRRAGHPPAVVDRTVRRLAELGLVDDAAFAAAWAEHRAGRGRGEEAIVAELVARGVERSVAEAAVSGALPDELERAIALAAGRLRRLADLTPRRQGERLHGWLVRRGFAPEVAAEAARAVLPPEGWD